MDKLVINWQKFGSS